MPNFVETPTQDTLEVRDEKNRNTDAICTNQSHLEHRWYHNLKYVVAGSLLGLVFVKAEIISWFRIQEMFRLQSFHMYGIIGSAIAVASLSIWLIKHFGLLTIYSEEIHISPKTFNKGQIIGGLIFGSGWAITGACPGPLYAQVGAGVSVVLITVLSALIGTWTYAYLRDKLPH